MVATFSAPAGVLMEPMELFVPWSEELAEAHPDLVTTLVPYQIGMRCAHLAHRENIASAPDGPRGAGDREETPPRRDAA